MRRIQALKIEYSVQPLEFVVVWPDETDETDGTVHPADPMRHWLDVRRGDAIVVNGQRYTVSAVRLHRARPRTANGMLVESGRAWLKQADDAEDSSA